jgi:tetratricopeptide (TPR) repeat protein
MQAIHPDANTHGTVRRFLAEYAYDFGDASRAADYFISLEGDENLSLAASALWLSGDTAGAQALWALLAEPAATGSVQTQQMLRTVRAYALYNLAATQTDAADAGIYLERLFALGNDTATENAGPDAPADVWVYGTIRYTRLLPESRAQAILEEANRLSPSPLLELELLRLARSAWGVDRTVAELWLLINRYPQEAQCYEWAAWFLDFQKRYDEEALLLDNAARRGLIGAWAEPHEALSLIRGGQFDAAEALLSAMYTADRRKTSWRAAANLGRLCEWRRTPARALEYYRAATAILAVETALQPQSTRGATMPATAAGTAAVSLAKVELATARCYRSLGQTGNARAALERALALDPDNIAITLELRRLET